MARRKSVKARAWHLAAAYLSTGCLVNRNNWNLTEEDERVRDHLMKYVIPSLRRRADIIERNKKPARPRRER